MTELGNALKLSNPTPAGRLRRDPERASRHAILRASSSFITLDETPIGGMANLDRVVGLHPESTQDTHPAMETVLLKGIQAMGFEVLGNQSQPVLLRQTGLGVCRHGSRGLRWAVTPRAVATTHLLGN